MMKYLYVILFLLLSFLISYIFNLGCSEHKIWSEINIGKFFKMESNTEYIGSIKCVNANLGNKESKISNSHWSVHFSPILWVTRPFFKTPESFWILKFILSLIAVISLCYICRWNELLYFITLPSFFIYNSCLYYGFFEICFFPCFFFFASYFAEKKNYNLAFITLLFALTIREDVGGWATIFFIFLFIVTKDKKVIKYIIIFIIITFIIQTIIHPFLYNMYGGSQQLQLKNKYIWLGHNFNEYISNIKNNIIMLITPPQYVKKIILIILFLPSFLFLKKKLILPLVLLSPFYYLHYMMGHQAQANLFAYHYAIPFFSFLMGIVIFYRNEIDIPKIFIFYNIILSISFCINWIFVLNIYK